MSPRPYKNANLKDIWRIAYIWDDVIEWVADYLHPNILTWLPSNHRVQS